MYIPMFVLSSAVGRGGQRIACDLLRVVARVRSAELREGLRRRLSAFSAGYLVSEEPPAEPAFTARREWHQYGFNAYAATSSRWPCGIRWDYSHGVSGRGGVVAGGPLDAPEEIAAGSMISCFSEPHARIVARGEDCTGEAVELRGEA